MGKIALVVLLLSSLSFGQTAPQPKTAPVPPRHRRAVNAPAAEAELGHSTPNIPPTAPVITLGGYCPDAPGGTDSKSPQCKTVITKADFEKLVDVISPKMPVQGRQNLANDYAKMLVLSHEAKRRGVENTERYKTLMQFVALQLQSQELLHILQAESKPTDAEVQKYYQDHGQKYEEVSVKRIFIPRNRADAKAEDKMPTDEDLQADGEKVKARVVAGEDFDKVQKEIYAGKGYTAPPPPTSVSNWRVESIPPTQASVSSLKQGEYSPVIVEAAGAYIYRLDQKSTTPLDSVRTGIESELASEKMRAKLEALTSSIKPELNQAYFHPPTPAPTPGEGVIAPPGGPEAHQPITPMANAPAPAANAPTPKADAPQQ